MANDRNRENTRNSSQSGSGREDESKRMPGSQDRNPSGYGTGCLSSAKRVTIAVSAQIDSTAARWSRLVFDMT